MNNRQRFKAIMSFKSVDRYLNSELGVWEQTIDRWENEGMPKGTIKNSMLFNEDKYFGIDTQSELHINIAQPYPFENKKIIYEDNRHEIYIDELGIKRKRLKVGSIRGMDASIDQILVNPVKDRDSWKSWKKKFIGNYDKRLPINFNDNINEWENRDYILYGPGGGELGFYSFLRNLMGFEVLSLTLFDDIKLIEEILEFLTEYFIGLLKEILSIVELDWFEYFEDMSYKKGPLISTDMVEKLLIPRYEEINNLLNRNGVKIISVDSDGNIDELIPLFLKAGINCVSPLEVNAGMDVVKLRKQYGKDLLMMGGINKIALTKDKRTIKDEVYNKIAPIVDKGGFIPMVDHLIPPDVPYENFIYYLDLKRKLLQCC